MTTYTEAVDAMFSLFKTAWDADTAAIAGSVPYVHWQGVESPDIPVKDAFWCMVGTQTVSERQSTFKTGIAPNDNRRYTASGLITVQLFCPMSDAQAMDIGRQLAVVARDSFRGQETANAVWFRNARIAELPPENDAYRFNIVIEYEYDDIG